MPRLDHRRLEQVAEALAARAAADAPEMFLLNQEQMYRAFAELCRQAVLDYLGHCRPE